LPTAVHPLQFQSQPNIDPKLIMRAGKKTDMSTTVMALLPIETITQDLTKLIVLLAGARVTSP
jgi:hypothetical protein